MVTATPKTITARHKTIRRLEQIARVADRAIRDGLDRHVDDAEPVMRAAEARIATLAAELVENTGARIGDH